MVLWSEESAGDEESLREKKGSGSGEVAEGLVSYNPKRKKCSRVKIPRTARANKKRKTASSIPVETPPIRGRATRSQKKQSKAELEKALEESKRKAAAKGNKKVVEPVEAVKIEEMNLVLCDKDKVEEEEVETPKTKKRKSSKKKSPSKTKSAEPSTLAKRNRSAIKSRKGEESEEEEEIDDEQDKKEKFGKITILKGRLLRDLEEEGMVMLLQ
ncbi:uncharacterized protein [Nicotiana tomentosiformis]|uniref:uncharacterized protein n=1 Tax=Nicotiana tomentosiformis TaxID=4098 RepID=UPI00388CA314